MPGSFVVCNFRTRSCKTRLESSMCRRLSVTLFAALCSQIAYAADWTQFRGPGGRGVSDEAAAPTSWSDQQNVIWRTELPGLGTSSPIVLGQRIYLTCYSGYGRYVADPGEMRDLVRHVICLDRSDGEVLWKKPFAPRLPESEYSGGTRAKHGYSSSTATTDGERLYVFFGKSGVYCLDLEGNELWHTRVGDRTAGWGSSNSPVLHENLLIINASVESRSLVALNKRTGELVWEQDGISRSWNTPALVSLPGGKTELVVSIQGSLLAFDPGTGDELWRCEGIPTYVCPSVISHEGVVYASGGRGTQYTLAVRAGGRGNVTQTHQLWRVAKGSNVSSPVYHDGHVYVMNDSRGIAYCFDAASGELVYGERLQPRPGLIYSSPTRAGNNIYFVSQHAGTFVLAADPDFKLVAHNVFDDDDSRSNACPVVHDGQLLLRNDRYLYCIGRR